MSPIISRALCAFMLTYATPSAYAGGPPNPAAWTSSLSEGKGRSSSGRKRKPRRKRPPRDPWIRQSQCSDCPECEDPVAICDCEDIQPDEVPSFPDVAQWEEPMMCSSETLEASVATMADDPSALASISSSDLQPSLCKPCPPVPTRAPARECPPERTCEACPDPVVCGPIPAPATSAEVTCDPCPACQAAAPKPCMIPDALVCSPCPDCPRPPTLDCSSCPQIVPAPTRLACPPPRECPPERTCEACPDPVVCEPIPAPVAYPGPNYPALARDLLHAGEDIPRSWMSLFTCKEIATLSGVAASYAMDRSVRELFAVYRATPCRH